MMDKKLMEAEKLDKLILIAKEYAIANRCHMRKSILIEKILEADKLKNKQRYISNAKSADIIAFKLPNGRALSGMIIKLNEESFYVETKNGRCFTVPHVDVIWVKTNGRWPRPVYLLLKGGTDNGSAGNKTANC